MAPSRDLTHRLQLEDEPIAKRLKLAEDAFTCVEGQVTKNEDSVLKWLCEIGENSMEEEEVVWSTLHRCLRLKNLSSDNFLKSEIKEMLVQTLINKLASTGKGQLYNVLQCCELLFSTCKMQRYFRSKPARLAELMKALFKSVFQLSKIDVSEEADLLSTTNSSVSKNASSDVIIARKCAASAVECFVTCYKQSPNKDEFAELFLREILYPLCSLIDRTGSDRLGAEIHKSIQQLIFGKSRYSQFKTFNGKVEKNFAGKVFEELKKDAETADRETSLVVFLYVFRAAVGSYKNDPVAIDTILRNLLDSAGPVKVELLGCLSQQLANITFDYQNKIDDTTLFEYLQKFIDEILLAKQLGSADFDALAVIAVLNPLIIETKLQNVLKKILLEKKETATERDSYGNLMISILNAEVRLRREQKLIPWILTAIKQTLNEREGCDLDVDTVFPINFKDQFTKAVVNMTSTQMIGVFRSLTFHLNALCEEFSGSNKSTAIFMLQANVDLMAAFFRGVRIFDHTVPLTGQEKFAQALNDLGKTIALLTERALKAKRKKKMISAILTVTWYWDSMYHWLKYYAPNAISENLEFPISEDSMQNIVQSIDNSQNKIAMNKIVVQQIGRNLQEGSALDASSLLGGFEKSWAIIVDQSPHIIMCMDNQQIAELARLLLEDAKACESMKKLSLDSVQSNERLVKALVCQTFVNVGTSVDESSTKSILEHVNVVKILDRGKISKLLKEIRKEFAKNEWTLMDPESACAVEHDLQVLLNLPLTHLSQDLRTVILLVAYAIKKECERSVATCELCTQIILDVLEKSDIDIIDYVDAKSLVHELPSNIGIQRAIESSLRKVSAWETLKVLVKESENNDECLTVLLECVEKTKSKSSLKTEQKELLKKAEQKLRKKLLEGIKDDIKDHREVKRLSIALTTIAPGDDIPDRIVNLTKSALDHIFSSKSSRDEKLVAEGMQLLRTILKKRLKFEISPEVVENVWPLVIKSPSKELVGSLLETTQAKLLNRILHLLHKQTISGLDESNDSCFTSALVIWDSVTYTPMKGARDKCRVAAILDVLEALQVSKIPAKSWPGVLRLVQSILARHSHAIEKGIDAILTLTVRSLREIEFSACEDVLAISFLLMKFQVDFAVDRLPDLLPLYRHLVRLVVRESRTKLDSSSERKLRCLALDIAKFTNSLVKSKKELAGLSPNVIADLVEMFSEGVIPAFVKGPLEDSAAHFLSICDNRDVSRLPRSQPAATQEIFKNLYETYNKFYKYTGKI